MSSVFFITAFLLGLGGSLHCIGMCGPLVMSMPFEHVRYRRFSLLLFLAAKALGYGLIGLLFGSFGQLISIFNWQQILSIVAGILLLLITMLPYAKQLLTNNFGFHFIQQTLEKFKRKQSLLFFFLLGLANSLLPCGILYTALAGATVTLSATQGFLFMLMFGIGTMPVMIALIVFKAKLSVSFRSRLKNTSYYFSMVMAVLLIIRGMNLGIPYLSPEVKISQHKPAEIKCCAKPISAKPNVAR
jgi:sulfite exporter TauE/SafE